MVLQHPLWHPPRRPGDGESCTRLARVLILPPRADPVKVQMQVDAHFVSDVLRGNDSTEMRITLLRYIDDEMPADDE